MLKIVKVGTVPGRIQEVSVETGTKVKEAIELAGLTSAGYEIKVNGRTTSENDSITSTTEAILLVARVKGNAPILVKVGTVPGRIQEVSVESGATVKEAIELAGLTAAGYEVKLNGRTVSETERVNSSTSVILLVAKVKGNKGNK